MGLKAERKRTRQSKVLKATVVKIISKEYIDQGYDYNLSKKIGGIQPDFWLM